MHDLEKEDEIPLSEQPAEPQDRSKKIEGSEQSTAADGRSRSDQQPGAYDYVAAADAQDAERASHRASNESMLAAANDYRNRGWHLIELQHRSKVPAKGRSWKDCVSNLALSFSSGQANVGVALGAPSGGLVDVDLDWPQAAVIGAFVFQNLPSFGRKGAPGSHRLAVCPEAKNEPDKCLRVKFALPPSCKGVPGLPDDHALMIVEVRANGGYTMFPPSTHPSGERVAWDGEHHTPPEVPFAAVVEHAGLTAFLACCARFYPGKGQRDDFCMALTGALLRAFSPPTDKEVADNLVSTVDELVTLVARMANDEEHRKRGKARAASASLKAGKRVTGMPRVVELLGLPKDVEQAFRSWLGADADDRPVITYDETNLSKILTLSQQSVLEGGCKLFQRAGKLVNTVRWNADTPNSEGDSDIKRATGALVIGEVNRHLLRIYMTDHARFRKWSPRWGWQFIAPPLEFCDAFASWTVGWRMPTLHGIVETPTLREDGTLLATQGYDPSSGMLVDFGGVTYEPINERPTRFEAEVALAKLVELFVGFPFVDGDENNNDPGNCRPGDRPTISRSVAVSAILTALVRRSLPSAPMHLFDATAAGTGKSLLVDVVSRIATGKDCPAMSFAASEEENEKRLVSALLCGDGSLNLDNVSAPIGGDTLCSVLTQSAIKPRKLGGNEVPIIPTNVFLTATGNNIAVKGDMVRRVVKARLDAGRDNPEERRFDRDLRVEALRRRPELVAAALTILLAFQAAPDRQETLAQLPPYGSFERWSELVRGALIWLKQPDPCASKESVRDADPITAAVGTVVAAWAGCEALPLGTWFSTGQIAAAADPGRTNTIFANALAAALPRGNISPETVGRFLSRHKDRVVGGYRIRKRSHPTTRLSEYLLESGPKFDPEPKPGVDQHNLL